MKKIPIGIWLTDLHLELNTLEIVEDVMGQAIDKCSKLGVKTIFLGGDIFDSRKGQPMDVLKAWLNILDSCDTLGIKVDCIPGNHDKTDYSKDDSFLDVYRDHPAFQLRSHYDFRPWPDGKGLVFHFLPYYTDQVYYDQLKDITLTEKDTHILFTHIGIDGAMANGNFAIESDLTDILFDQFNQVYVGHYHNRHDLSDKIHYTGSAYPRNFGEDNDKGLGILMSDGTMEYEKLNFSNYFSLWHKKLTVKGAEGIIAEKGNDHIRVIVEEVDPEAKDLLNFHGVKVITEASIDVVKASPSAKVFTDGELLQEFKDWGKKKKPKFATTGKEIIESILL